YPFAPPEPQMPRPEHPNSIEEIVDVMERHGVDRMVLVQVRYYGWDNRYLADCLRRYPGRFAAQGLLAPRDPAVPQQLERLVREDGFSGIRLSPSYHAEASWLGSPASFPLWRKAEGLGAVFNFLIREEQLPELAEMAERFPGVRVIVDHMGYPDITRGRPENLLARARLPYVYLKVTESSNSSRTPTYPYTAPGPTARPDEPARRRR